MNVDEEREQSSDLRPRMTLYLIEIVISRLY